MIMMLMMTKMSLFVIIVNFLLAENILCAKGRTMTQIFKIGKDKNKQMNEQLNNSGKLEVISKNIYLNGKL